MSEAEVHDLCRILLSHPWLKLSQSSTELTAEFHRSVHGSAYTISVEHSDSANVSLRFWRGAQLLVERTDKAAAVCELIRSWAHNLAHDLQPHEDHPPSVHYVRDLKTRAWSPPGSRLHVLVLGRWHVLHRTFAGVARQWSHVLVPVPADRLHITLGWLRHPLSEGINGMTVGSVLQRVRDSIFMLPSLRAVRLAGRFKVTPYGVRLILLDRDAIYSYSVAATQAIRGVFGDDYISDAHPFPHLTVAYAKRDAYVGDLAAAVEELALDETTLGACRIAIADVDTFSPSRWDWKVRSVLPI